MLKRFLTHGDSDRDTWFAMAREDIDWASFAVSDDEFVDQMNTYMSFDDKMPGLI
jgi:hypothetical protein